MWAPNSRGGIGKQTNYFGVGGESQRRWPRTEQPPSKGSSSTSGRRRPFANSKRAPPPPEPGVFSFSSSSSDCRWRLAFNKKPKEKPNRRITFSRIPKTLGTTRMKSVSRTLSASVFIVCLPRFQVANSRDDPGHFLLLGLHSIRFGGDRGEWKSNRYCDNTSLVQMEGVNARRSSPAPFHGAIPSRLVAPPGGGPAKNQKS